MLLTLGKVFEKLSYGELSNLAISGEGSGTIVEAQRAKVTSIVDDGLLKLYSRFVLKERELLLLLNGSITNYHLLPRFSVNYDPAEDNYDEPIRYIIDLPEEPFQDEVIRVLSVYDGKGHRVPLNDDSLPWSVFTPQIKVLQVPRPKHEGSLNVGYQARHMPLSGSLDEVIELPDTLHGALNSFVAHKIYSNMNTQESTVKAQEHYSAFDSACIEIERNDLVSNSVSNTNNKFVTGGWI